MSKSDSRSGSGSARAQKLIERAACYVVERLEERMLLSGVVGTPSVDVGVPYNLGLNADYPTPAGGYRVNWGPSEGTSDVAGTAIAFAPHVYTHPGVYQPVVQGLDASGNPIAGSDSALALDPTFGDQGRVFSTFFHPDTTPYYAATPAYSVLQQSDGKIVIGGRSDLPDGRTEYIIARYRADGSLDSSFAQGGKFSASFYGADDTAGSSTVNKVVLQRDGKILVIGTASTTVNGQGKDFAVARYNADGSLDATFGDDGVVRLDLTPTGATGRDDTAYDVTVQKDGKILLTGSAGDADGYSDMVVVRLSTYGELDPTFGDQGVARIDFGYGPDEAHGIAVNADGKILVGGASGGGLFALARLTAAGAIDDTFDGGSNFNGKVTAPPMGGQYAVYGVAMAAQADGRIVLLNRVLVGIGWDYGIARFNSDGTLDSTFNPNGTGGVSAGTLLMNLPPGNNLPQVAAVQPADGKIIFGGIMTKDGVNQSGLFRLNSDGTPDASFGIDGQLLPGLGDIYGIYGLGLQADGKILATGMGNGTSSLIRLQPNNTLTVSAAQGNGSVTIAPHAGTQLGQVREQMPFVIDLDAGASVAPDSWSVAWGDGQVQTYTGDIATAVHVYSGAPNTYQVVATAIDGGVHHPSNTLRVTVALDRPLANDVPIIDDGTPAGATFNPYSGNFQWSTSDPVPFRGTQSLVSNVDPGPVQTFIDNLQNPTLVNAGDVLYGYVWLDPAHVPDEIMLGWLDTDGSWEHRAYWGRNVITTWGLTDGTAGYWPMGTLPAASGWVRLEVPAERVGMVGKSISGIDFVVANGRAAFDDTGVNRKPAGPSAPTALVASAQGGSAIRLSWLAGVGQGKYRVMRSDDGVNYSPIAIISKAATSFIDGGVTPGSTHWYRVDAYAGEAFTRSSVVSATTPAAGSGVDTSHGLTALYYSTPDFTGPAVGTIEQNLDLNWGNGAPVAGVGYDAFSVEFTGSVTPTHASGSQPYTFYVEAQAGVRLWVNGQLLVDHPDDQPYGGDADLDGLVDDSDMQVVIAHYGDQTGLATWAEGDFTGDGNVDDADLAIAQQNYGTTDNPYLYPAGDPSAATISLTAGQTYDIKLQVSDAHAMASVRLLWKTPSSGSVRQDVPLAQLTPNTGLLAAPSNLTTVESAVGQITLHWSDPSAGTTSFEVERKAELTGTYATIGTVAAGTMTYVDTNRWTMQ